MVTKKYLKTDTANLFEDDTSENVRIELLWGDRIEVFPGDPVNGRVAVRARGLNEFVNESDLGDEDFSKSISSMWARATEF